MYPLFILNYINIIPIFILHILLNFIILLNRPRTRPRTGRILSVRGRVRRQDALRTFFHPLSFCFGSNQTQFTKHLYNQSYLHYLQYNENDTIRELLLFLGLTDQSYISQNFFSWRIPGAPILNHTLYNVSHEFQKLKNQNNITEAYNTYNGTICLYTYKINLSEYTNLTCLL